MKYRCYHYALSPFCRKLRLVLSEKAVEFELIEEKYWEKNDAFLRMNPAGKVPVLTQVEIDEDVFGSARANRTSRRVFTESHPICEYIDCTHPGTQQLMPEHSLDQYETRRLVNWFDEKFHTEVTRRIVGEKLLRKIQRTGPTDASVIRAGLRCLDFHLEYMAFLLKKRKWLACDSITLADFAAAAHISCLDFVGDIAWEDHPTIKGWYSTIKSRPSFQPLLNEFVPSLPPPPACYSNLDF